MNSNARIIGAVLASLGAWFVASQIRNVAQHHRKLATKKLAREAVHDWEGEGGTIADPVPRHTAG